jgi:hypothetical protein
MKNQSPCSSRRDSGTFEEMLTIANKYAMAEEVTLDTREQKKDKELGCSDQPSSSNSHDMKRKADRCQTPKF